MTRGPKRFPPRDSQGAGLVLAQNDGDGGCSLTFDDVASGDVPAYEAGKTYTLTARHHSKGQMLVGATVGTIKIVEGLKVLKASGTLSCSAVHSLIRVSVV